MRVQAPSKDALISLLLIYDYEKIPTNNNNDEGHFFNVPFLVSYREKIEEHALNFSICYPYVEPSDFDLTNNYDLTFNIASSNKQPTNAPPIYTEIDYTVPLDFIAIGWCDLESVSSSFLHFLGFTPWFISSFNDKKAQEMKQFEPEKSYYYDWNTY